MRASKIILTIGSLLFVLILAGGIYLYMNLGILAKSMSENIASKTLGVPVNIGSMSIDIPAKTVKVEKLEIANPKGFKTPHALTVDSISISASSLSRDLLVFDNISVTGTKAYVAVTNAGTNFNEIRKNVALNNQKKQQQAAKEPEEKIKVIIKDLIIAESTLTPALLLEDVDVGNIKVSTIEMSGIGEKQNGVLASEAIAQIWEEISDEFNTSAAKAGMLKGLSVAALSALGAPILLEVPVVGDAIKDSAKNVGSTIKDGAENVGEAVNENLKKLFDY